MHGMYHQFSKTTLVCGEGASLGALGVSRFVRWTSLPVAIWPDQWYDGNAIFTGSATLDENGNR